MLREEVEGDAGLAERLKLGWVAEREPDIRNPNGTPANTAWLQERGNQLALLDTFFSAVAPSDSLCFFYAKRTPLSQQSRRVIIGVGRVSSVGEPVEYRRKDDAGMRCVLWERNVGHSIRPGFADGFLFPYREALALAAEEGVAPVINVVNSRRTDVWPKPEGEAYVANGDIGVVVGQYKGRKAKYKGLPWKIEVEFAGQRGHKYGFSRAELGDEGNRPLELAYAMTVHKTQGSEFAHTFVVLTNPCWLLSRELLYTALTRHRERLVVLHQGPLAAYRSFSSDQHSEVARRITNLFSAPTPKETSVGRDARFLEDGLIHRTENGDLVRSKSEVIIADKLYSRGIDYAYEQPLRLPNGRVRYPDFTITDAAMGVTFYWEHLGLLSETGYRSRWERKRAEYVAAGICPWQHGEDAEHVLIETQDSPQGGIDSVEVAKLIDEVIAA